ncbi:unnamed protein product [Urochloa humidicola]
MKMVDKVSKTKIASALPISVRRILWTIHPSLQLISNWVCKLEGFSLLAYGCIVCCKKRRHPRPFNHCTRFHALYGHVEGPSPKKKRVMLKVHGAPVGNGSLGNATLSAYFQFCLP